jgi:FecR protein
VETLRAGQTAWVPATVGARLARRDEIRAFGGGAATLQIPDGSTLFLAENSRLVVTELLVDRQQTRNAIFHVVVGKVRAAVAQAAVTLVRTRQSNFAITTPTAVAASRGTHYVVVYNLAQQTTSEATIQGEVLCYDLLTKSAVIVPLKRRTVQCGLPFELSPADEAGFVSPFNPFTGQPSDDPTPFDALIDPSLVDLANQTVPFAAFGAPPDVTIIGLPPGGTLPQAPGSFTPAPGSSPPPGPPGPPPPPGGGAGPPPAGSGGAGGGTTTPSPIRP